MHTILEKALHIGFAIRTTRQGILKIAGHANVAHWGLDSKLVRYAPALRMPTLWRKRPRYLWHFDRINKRKREFIGVYPVIRNQGKDVTVYIVDAGVDPSHLEFENRLFVGHSILEGQVGTLNTVSNEHGNLCAGVIAGKTVGIAPKANVISMQVFGGPNHSGTISDLIKALERIAEKAIPGKTVVSISIGSKCQDPETFAMIPCDEPLMRQAVEVLVSKMIPVVAAAGNDGISTCFQNPGSEPLVFTVGATDNQDKKLPKSNYGSCLDTFAPGGGIESAHPTLGYAAKTGTSMAAPIVAGVFAALRSTEPYSRMMVQQLYQTVIHWSTKGIVKNVPKDSQTHNRLLYVPFPKWEPQPQP